MRLSRGVRAVLQLEAARSNIPEQGDGRKIYESFVRPAFG